MAASVGKYVIYRVALDRVRNTTPLWLAIPQAAYKRIFSQAIGQAVINRIGASLIVYEGLMLEGEGQGLDAQEVGVSEQAIEINGQSVRG